MQQYSVLVLSNPLHEKAATMIFTILLLCTATGLTVGRAISRTFSL